MKKKIFFFILANIALAYAQINPLNYDQVRALSEINDINKAEVYPTISADGLRLYYTVSGDLMFCERTSAPGFFGPASVIYSPNLTGNISSYWLTEDELETYFTINVSPWTAKIYKSSRASISSPFGAPKEIILTNSYTYSFCAGVSTTASKDELFVYTSTLGENIHRYIKASPDTFQFVGEVNLPSGYIKAPGQLSKDGLSFITAAEKADTTDLYVLTRNNLNDTFDINTFTEIGGLDVAKLQSLPSVSGDLGWIVFSASLTGLYWDYELYIAYNTGIITSNQIINQENINKISIYPNPSSLGQNISILSEEPLNYLQIESLEGKVLFKQASIQSKSIDISNQNLAAGVYIVKQTNQKGYTISKKIIIK